MIKKNSSVFRKMKMN